MPFATHQYKEGGLPNLEEGVGGAKQPKSVVDVSGLPASVLLAQKILASRVRLKTPSPLQVGNKQEQLQPTSPQKRVVTSPFRPPTKKGRGPGKNNKPLGQLQLASSKKRRLRIYKDALAQIARQQNDNLIEVLGNLRCDFPALPEDVGPFSKLPLAPIFCLSMKCTAGMTDSQYKTVADATNAQLHPHKIYSAPNALKASEISLKPGYVRF